MSRPLFNRRHLLQSALVAAGVAVLSTAGLPARADAAQAAASMRSGMVFTSSNDAAGNQVLVFQPDASGGLQPLAQFDTGGAGSSAGLGSQGAVTLSGDGVWLFVVNAGSDTLSTFKIRRNKLELRSVVASGGTHPISVTEHDGVVYVLNDGADGNVTGFHNANGTLTPIAGATYPLSAAGGTAPAQVGFSTDGDTVVVTEKATNLLLSWPVAHDGTLGAQTITASPGQTPFGFSFNRRNRLVVTEAVGGAAGASTLSSYRVKRDDMTLKTVSPSVADFQGAACWVSVTPDGRLAYVANTGSSNVSAYRIAPGGAIELMAGVAGDTGAGSAPADTAISYSGRHLYVRNGGSLTISSFMIASDGGLTPAPLFTGLPAATVGLAAN